MGAPARVGAVPWGSKFIESSPAGVLIDRGIGNVQYLISINEKTRKQFIV